jgi:hypothetical protein
MNHEYRLLDGNFCNLLVGLLSNTVFSVRQSRTEECKQIQLQNPYLYLCDLHTTLLLTLSYMSSFIFPAFSLYEFVIDLLITSSRHRSSLQWVEQLLYIVLCVDGFVECALVRERVASTVCSHHRDRVRGQQCVASTVCSHHRDRVRGQQCVALSERACRQYCVFTSQGQGEGTAVCRLICHQADTERIHALRT